MKNKIAIKLTLSFFAALLVFSMLIGGVFMTLFRSHTIEVHKNELERRAITMASTISTLLGGEKEQGVYRGPDGMGGYGAYLRFLDDIAMADVWIVDKNLEVVTGGGAGRKYYYEDLPEEADTVVREVFEGRTTFGAGFSELLQKPVLTVGAPIIWGDKVMGALLLHSPVEGMDQAAVQGISILAVSMLAALLLSILLSALLAVAFTKPLKKMKDSALQLAGGDYSAKTGVRQNDEIGELAAAIDVLSERLSRAKLESQRFDALRRDFVANVSHELKTPVTVIRGSLEALCDEVVTEAEQVKSYHRQMLLESVFLQRLVNDLLDLSKLQNSDFKIEMRQINLVDALKDAVRSAGQMALAKNVDIKLESDTQFLEVTGDYGRLRQMFLIVLDNAVKFSREGDGITVSLKNKKISIRDNGPGIERGDLPYIFDRFYKVKSPENKTGSGLGLAIAKQIADRHHIGVSVTSDENEGTEFCFRF